VNGDGWADVAVACESDNRVDVLLGGREGLRPPISAAGGARPVALAIADVDEDGRLDLAVAAYGADVVRILRGHGDGAFDPQQILATGRGPIDLVLRDLDGDRHVDLAVVSEKGAELAFARNFGGRLAPSGVSQVAEGTRGLAAADVNGDGRVDLIMANPSRGDVSLLRGIGGN
jgi:hypothetical protein